MARKSRQATQQAQATGIPISSVPVVSESLPVKYKTAIYTRLSVYDLGRENGDTMENQVELLQYFVSQQSDLALADIYIDNGWTGTNFTRPEFQRLLEDAKLGRINCIVVKDLSRFGRNYLETGYYLQKLFPFYNLRFISINDGYDSLTADPDSLAISMKNIVNDYYSKDISRKVSSSLDLKRSQGVHSWGHAAYGYIRNPENPAILEIDAEVAPYVSLIFQWAMDGMPLWSIADHLAQIQAPTYQRLIHTRRNGYTRRTGSDVWSTTSIKQMLLNQTYAGDFVYQKSYFRKYDPTNGHWIPEEEWNIIPDNHPAYIDRDDYYRLKGQILSLQKERSQVIKSTQGLREQMPDLFKGLIFCGECQRRMGMRRDYRKGNAETNYKAYHCRSTGNQFRTAHPLFTINAETLEETVLSQINLQIKYAIKLDAFLRKMSMDDVAKQLKARRQAEINALKAKAADLRKRRSRTFEDFSDAIIDEEVYRIQMDKLAAKLDAITNQITAAEKRRDDVDLYFTVDNKWLRTFVETGVQDGMTPELIKLLIQRIDVYADKRIEITFNYADWMAPLLGYIEEAKELEHYPA